MSRQRHPLVVRGQIKDPLVEGEPGQFSVRKRSSSPSQVLEREASPPSRLTLRLLPYLSPDMLRYLCIASRRT